MTVYKFERVETSAPVGADHIKPSALPEWPHDLTRRSELRENTKEGKREKVSKPPLTKDMLTNEEKISVAVDFLKMASPESIAKALGKIEPEALESFFRMAVEESGAAVNTLLPTPRPADVVPLWAERITGREVSPVDWIKMHYGNKDPKNWHAMGLTRAELVRIDQSLYKAYAQWIGRHEDEALRLPTKSEVLNEKAKRLGLLDLAASDDSLKVAAALRVRAFRRK